MIQKVISLFFKAWQKFYFILFSIIISRLYTKMLFYVNNVKTGKGFSTTGVPYVAVGQGASVLIGKNFRMHNSLKGNPIGRWQKSILVIGPKANLIIGDNVGISFTAINCKKSIHIGNNVMIGGGTCIYDSDFHPLNSFDRIHNLDKSIAKGDVIIEDNAFIGANSTILKGVMIGKNSIIGACSVVVKNVPASQIWGGNPARFLKNVSTENIT